jgi:hypothetical protein
MEGNFNTTVSLFNSIRVYAQVDFMYDYTLYNNTDQFRERQFGTGERWVRRNDILTDEERLGRFGPFVTETGAPCNNTAANCPLNASAVNALYYEPGDHIRFRELSVSYTLRPEWVDRLGMSSAVVTVGGRNLALWTDYLGEDPEVLGAQTDFTRTDFLTMPQPRQWLVRMNVTF